MHPVVDRILDYRQVAKLKSTYVDALPEMVNHRTGRIHTSYNQTGSATGRISSSEPNLQTYPSAPNWAGRCGGLSSPTPAAVSCPPTTPKSNSACWPTSPRTLLCWTPSAGARTFTPPPPARCRNPVNQVDSEQRRIAKVLNFGVIYGLGPHGISQQTGFSREEGRNFIDTYLARYPGINGYLESVKTETRGSQYARNPAGPPPLSARHQRTQTRSPRRRRAHGHQYAHSRHRRRHYEKGDDQRPRPDAPRKDALQNDPASPRRTGFEAPDDEMDAMTALVLDEMPAALELDVTLKVDIKSGHSWGDF